MPVDITATQAAQLAEDVDGDGVADPGDTLTFSVTIENDGDTDAIDLEFAENLEGVTLVPGSINVSPIAFDDAYSVAGNIQVTIAAGSGVTANDVEFLSDTFSVTSFDPTSDNGGTVTVNADGSFNYASAVGFTGTDSFTYTVTDSQGLTSTATVEVTVGPSVWFIDNTAPGSTNVGTQANPFTSIAAFNAAQGTANGPQPGEIIYLRAGTYNEPDGINLTAGQVLIGQGENLVVTPTGGGPAQTIETGSHGETPIIQVTGAGNEAIQLSTDNSIRGLNLDAVDAGADGIEDGGGTVGTLTISNVEIKGAGQAIDIDQGGTLNVTLDSVTSTGSSEEGVQLAGTSGSFAANTVSLSGATGDAVDLNGNTGTVAINGGSIAAGNAGSIAVDIAGGANTVTIAANVTDTNSNDIVEITGRTGGTVTLSGNITASGGTSNGIDISGNTGGTVNFTGAAVNLATSANAAVNLSSNTGAAVNFNTTGNGLDISTTSGPGFSATGGGTVTVTGAGNTISSGTGTALNVANTTIGAADVTFQSISANGAANGIVLNNTGASGGLTVTGDGGGSNNGSGGTIQNTTGDGISLTATDQVRLGYMNITNNLGDGIGGNDVNGFLLNRVNITGNGNDAATDESGINIAELTGGSSASTTPTGIVNSVISNNNEFELQITNTSGTLTDFQLTNNTISSNGLPINGNGSSPHGNLVNFLALGSANMTLNTNGGTYTGNWNAASPPATITATAIQVDHSGTSGTMTANINGGTFTNNNVAVSVSAANGGGIVFDVDGTTSTGNRSHGLNLFVAANSTGVVTGSFTDNTVGTLGVDGSGSELGFGIRVQNEALATANPVTVEIDGNTVQETEQFSAININQGIAGQASSRTTNATITDNIIRQVDSGRAIVVQQNNNTNASSAGTTNLDIHGNTIDLATIAGQVGDGTVMRLRQLDANGGDMNVVQLAPTAGAGASELDNANGFNEPSAGAEISLSGSIDFGQSAPPLPLLAAPGEVDTDCTTPDQPSVPDLPTVEAPTDPAPATPESPTGPVDDDHAVSAAELTFLVEAAQARWAAAGLNAAQVAALEALTFSIEDMSGLYLGAFQPGHVTLDSDAAGYGWFVDATPDDDAEFAITGTRGLLTATAEGGAAGHMDLLATIMHEMGHALGLEDTYALSDRGDIMYGYLSAGYRRLVDDGRADGAVVGAVTSEEFIGAPISIGTLPSGQQVVIEWQATVDEQTGQFVIDPVNFGTVSGSNFAAEDTNSVVIGVDELTLSGTLFNDLDGDGTKDAGEAGVSGVTVSLFVDANNDNLADGAAIGTDVTDGAGDYSFVGLAPGNYIVAFDQIGTLPSASPSGGDPDNDADNDSNGTLAAGVVSSQAITLSYNGETVSDGGVVPQLDINDTLDFGIFNAAPAINNLDGDTASWTEGDAAVILDQGTAAAIVDDGADFNGGSLTVSVTANEDAGEDLLGISTAGTVSLSAGLSAGSVVSVGGVAIGEIAGGGSAGDDLVVNLNTGDATSARLAVLVSAITYLNIGGDDPTAASRTVTFTVEDGNGVIGSADVAVGVTAIDDPAVAFDDAAATSESTPLSGASVFADNGSGTDSDPDSPLVVGLVNGVAFSDGVPITLASGALLTMNADGTFDYDPNGQFNALPGPASGASNLTGEDSFTYTLAGGGAATVTITISGEDSDGDVLEGTPGDDALAGGIGSDTYYVENSTDTVTELVGEGDADRAIASTHFTLAAGQEIEFLETSDADGTAAINLRGNALQQTIEGNDGNNILHDGGTGPLPDDGVPDTLIGHGGDDTYIVYDPEAVIVEVAGEGSDRVAAGVNYVLDVDVSVEYLNTTSLRATYAVNLTGNNLVQWMRGNDGANVLDGGGGSDNIFGMGGADTFRFSTDLAPDNIDRIRDFNVADDTIQLDSAIFTELAPGPLAASAFKDVFLAAKDADDRIIYNSNTGGLFYDHDGAGGDAAVKFARLEVADGLGLSAADFVVI